MGLFQFIKGSSPKADGLVEKGLTELKSGRLEEARQLFTEALKADKNNAEAYFQRGNVRRKLGKNQEAIRDYDKSIFLNPANPESYGNRGTVKQLLGKLDEALADYNQALSLNPKLVSIYNNRAHTNFKLGKFKEAISDYNHAIKIKPDYSLAYYHRAKSYAAIGEKEKAISDFNEVVRIDPEKHKGWYHRGEIYFDLGRFQEAADDLREAVQLNPKNADAYYKLGIAKNRLGRKEEAINAFSDVIRLQPKNARAYYNLGNGNFAIGRFDPAIKDYTKALKLNPNLALAYYGRATARIATQDKENAIRDLDRYLQLAENSPGEDTRLRDEAIKFMEMLKTNTSKIEAAPANAPELKPTEGAGESVSEEKNGDSAIKNIRFEAILYIDICDSTVIIDSFGEMHFNNMISVLNGPLGKFLKKYDCAYHKSTGDGWMLAFDRCIDAIELGSSILKVAEEHNKTAKDNMKIDMRLGVDCGQVLVREDMDRCGDPANVAKRIEGLTQDSFVELSDEVKENFPVKNRVFISAKVLTMIRGQEKIKFRDIGWAELKGKPGVRFQIFEILFS